MLPGRLDGWTTPFEFLIYICGAYIIYILTYHINIDSKSSSRPAPNIILWIQ
jgi:hypothetical protein